MKLALLKTKQINLEPELTVVKDFLKLYFPITIEVQEVADGPWQYKEYAPGLYGVDFDQLKVATDAEFVMLLDLPERSNVVSWAQMSPAGQRQFSQVHASGNWRYPALHELGHSLHAYFGKLDRTHDFTEGQARFGELYTLISSFIPVEPNIDWFVKKYVGRRVGHPLGIFGQCVALYRLYLDELKVSQTPSVKSAYQIWDTTPFAKTTVPQTGDIVVWGRGFGPDGHVAIVISATSSSIKVTEQNNPTRSPCRVWDHPIDNKILGFLRPIINQRSKETMLIRPIGSPEIAYVSPKGVRHPLTMKAWSFYHDSADPVEVSQVEYDKYGRGAAHFYSASFGDIKDNSSMSDREIWEAEPMTEEVVE